MNTTKQFMTRTKVIAALATTLMSTAAISSAALAEDGKVHPGSMCQPFVGADVQKLNHVGGATSNNSTSPVEVRCPIIRDNVNTTDNGGNGPSASIQVQRLSSGSGAIECELRTFLPNGDTGAQSSKFSFSGFGDFTFNIPFVRQFRERAYEIGCKLHRTLFPSDLDKQQFFQVQRLNFRKI